MKKRSFEEFLLTAFPTKDPYKRKDFGWVTNSVKYLAIRVSYILYILGINANQISLFAALLTVPTFAIIYHGVFKQDLYVFILGFTLMALILFIDFADGPLSKISNYKYDAGNEVDNLPPDIVFFGTLIILGLLTENIYLTIAFIANAVFIITYQRNTVDSIPESKNWLLKLIHSRLSLLSVRIYVCIIFPLVCITYILFQNIGGLVAKTLVIFYIICSFIWVHATLQKKNRYKK